jgi:hypothetical protein
MDRVRWRFESKSHHVESTEQACPQFTDFHLNKMAPIITEPDLLDRRPGFDLEVMIDAYRHQLPHPDFSKLVACVETPNM